MQLRLRFITDKGVHSDSQLSYLFLHHFGLDNGSTLYNEKERHIDSGDRRLYRGVGDDGRGFVCTGGGGGSILRPRCEV